MNTGFTARAAEAVNKSYTVYASADLLQNREVISSVPLGEDAAVTVDGTASVRRTFSMSVPNGADYLPIAPEGILSPFLTEIRVWAGVTFPDGTSDRWAIFTGTIEEPKVTDTDIDLQVSITASDRASTLTQKRLAFPHAIAAGTLTLDAIQLLLRIADPRIEFDVRGGTWSATTPEVIIDELEDPWQHASDLASADGYEVFFDGMGVCVIRPVPDPNTSPIVWTFGEGAGAMTKAIDMTLTAKESISHAIVSGQALDGLPPIRSDQYDLDPDSPTYFDPTNPTASRFGDRPEKLTSDLITTQDQADNAARALLSRKRGAVYSVNFTHAPLTALDEFDVVGITRDRLSLDSAFTVQSFSIPLSPSGEMNPTCRSRRV